MIYICVNVENSAMDIKRRYGDEAEKLIIDQVMFE